MLPFLHKYLLNFTFWMCACLLQFFNPTFAQTETIDSLKKILPFLKDSARIDCMNELGAELSDRYWSRSKYQQTDSAYMYTVLALNESRQRQYLKGIGKSWLNMSIIEEEHGNFIAAEINVQKGIAYSAKRKCARRL